MGEEKPAPVQPSRTIVGIIPRHTHRHLLGLAALALVIIVSLIWVAIHHTNNPKLSYRTHFLYTNSSNYTATITDSSDKVITKAAYSPNNYVNYEAVTPDGTAVLLSLGTGGSQESFTLIKDGKSQPVPSNVSTALSSSTVIDSRHQLFFSDDNTIAAVICAAGSTCKLETVDITSGKTDMVVDSGVKPGAGLPPVYLLGLSADSKVAYMRVIGKGSLSDSPGALYQIDLKRQSIVKEIDLSQNIGYSVSLSPDKQKLIYKTGGYTAATTIHLLDLKTYKDSTAKWSAGQISDLPSAFTWSPDSSRVVLHTQNITVPEGVAPVSNKLTLAYLDVSKMSLTTLETLSDPSHNNFANDGWLDSSTVIYQTASTNGNYDFDNGTVTTYKQSASSKQATKIQSYGSLNYVIYY